MTYRKVHNYKGVKTNSFGIPIFLLSDKSNFTGLACKITDLSINNMKKFAFIGLSLFALWLAIRFIIKVK